jgi:DnaK suppressor protein
VAKKKTTRTSKKKPATTKKKVAAKKPAGGKKKAAATRKTTRKKAAAKKASTKKTAKKATTRKKTATKKKAPSRGPRKKVTSISALKGYDKVGENNNNHAELSESQLRKVKSGLTRKDMNRYRQLLIDKRAEILGDVESLENDARNENGEGISYEHMADAGSDYFEQEFTLGLMESERKLLKLINEALVRMKNGTYGVCVERGVPIGTTRLDAKPWAKWCIDTAREKEKLGQL